ncbi:ATP-grasp domain-containing protein [Burkholderia sp. D-99]|uniref:ATP-grasp domain-containing protein n=1 Tax=Burkholderia sp. D-99 TaxID=2717316 RepID=UPI00387E2195
MKAEPVDGFIRRGTPRRDSVLRLPRSVASPTPIPVRSTSTLASKPTRAGSARPVALVMLYMAGSDRSIAMICEAGRPAAFVGRRKQGLHQTLENNSAAVELALKAPVHFKCDDLANAQARGDGRRSSTVGNQL